MNFENIKTLTYVGNTVIIDGEEIVINTSLDAKLTAVQFHKGNDFCIEEPSMKRAKLSKYQYVLDEFKESKEKILNPVLSLDDKKQLKITQLKNSINYEADVPVADMKFKGGYVSVQKLDSKRRLVIETGGSEVTYIDANDNPITLTLEAAKNVCLTVAQDYEEKFFNYKAKKKEILNASTQEELDLITWE